MKDMLGEIYLERTQYLLDVDKLMEEMLARAPDLKTVSRAKTVCCGVIIDTTQMAESTDPFPICINNCRMFAEGN